MAVGALIAPVNLVVVFVPGLKRASPGVALWADQEFFSLSLASMALEKSSHPLTNAPYS
jgi:hypothetical protein